MKTTLPQDRFDLLAFKIAEGTASPAEREEFISAAQKDREILGRLADYIDRQTRAAAQAAILSAARPKPRGTVAACGACAGSGRIGATEGDGRNPFLSVCPRCRGSGRMPRP